MFINSYETTSRANPETQSILRGDKYLHYTGTADEYPEIARKAWLTHAEGYVTAGLAKPEAVDVNGFLVDTIDKSRSLAGITYYYVENPDDCTDNATSRLVSSNWNTLKELPTYSLCEGGIDNIEFEKIEKLVADGYQVREFGALAKSKNGRSLAVSEIIRSVLHSTAGKKQILYCSMVKEVHDLLCYSLSPSNFHVIGKETVLPENEYRRETVLRPIIMVPDNFVDNIYNEYLMCTDEDQKHRYLKTLEFMSKGMSHDVFTPELSGFLIRDRG